MNWHRLALGLGCGLFASGATAQEPYPSPAPASQNPRVYVVAPGGSALKEAQRLMRFCRWSDTTALRDADMVLVVVRSSGSSPLAPFYDSLKWLVDEASAQLNDSGAQFHTYLFSIRSNLSLDQANHRSYDAEGSTLGEDLRRPRLRYGFGCDAY